MKQGGYDINKWELLGSRIGLQTARTLRIGPWSEARKWIYGRSGETEGESVSELTEQQVSKLMSIMPEELTRRGARATGAFGIGNH